MSLFLLFFFLFFFSFFFPFSLFFFSLSSPLFFFLPRFFFFFFLLWFQYMEITKPPTSAMRILHSSNPIKVEKLFNGSDSDLWRRGPVGLNHQQCSIFNRSNPDLRGPVGLMMKTSCEASSSRLSSTRNQRS